MKNEVLTVLLLLFYQISLGQICSCKTQPNLNEIISCNKTILKNGAKIYREFNCDSSWVIFESKNKNRKILFSLDKDLMEYTGRLGFAEWTEYKNSFLVEYHTISGCCDPYEYILYDKNNGKKLANIGREIYNSKIEKYPFFVTIDKDNSNYLSFLNLNTNKIFKINLPKDRIKKTMKITNEIFAETLFENGEIKNGVFEIKYKYKMSKNDKWLIGKITVDLKNTPDRSDIHKR